VLLFKQCVCVKSGRKSSALCGTNEKEKSEGFFFGQDTHKEINWGFL
jgi:hypothetical protein